MVFWTLAYKYGWATKVQLKQAVIKQFITSVEYQTITGEAYQA